ncbi:MAG: aminomethyl-transferring glycine dehydrogenase subunit GcvPA [Chloroflexi bacterium]|nr:aminomethyl-transferring glycine dehydrogenase subunit GcvPA [Chloroflexota bacterium]
MNYVPNTDAERAEMLAAIGVPSAADLFADVPAAHRRPRLILPPPLSEIEMLAELQQLSERNADLGHYACFLGAGAYRHFIPSVVGHVIGRSEFYTAYTPYQPEVSQGTLQAIYEYQSMVCGLTGMEVANASHYDGATAFAEAAMMAVRATGRRAVAIANPVNPEYEAVLRTYALGPEIAVGLVRDVRSADLSRYACVLVQQPSFYGCLEDLAVLVELAHGARALFVVLADPVSLGLLKPPGALGADIAVGDGQAIATLPSFGGPSFGFFASKMKYVREMPGRIVGMTTDHEGRRGFVLTLQAREQHIRRERATSNICTNQALVALAATAYLAAMGKQGLRKVAELCYHKAHYAALRIAELPGYRLAFDAPFFQEFVVHCPAPPAEINRRLLEHRIVGGLDVGDRIENGMLLCVTEMNTRAEIDRLVGVLGRVGGAA